MSTERLLEAGMRAERTPAELLAWINRTQDELCATEEGRKRFRLAKGAVKLLMEEIRPLALFGIWLCRQYPDLTVQPMADKMLPYDGVLRSTLWTDPRRIEISQATEGHQEHLRMRHLNEFGRAPAIGKIISSRENGKMSIRETPTVAEAANEIRANAFQLIRTTAEKKLNKLYPKDTWLLIVFDDNVGFSVGPKVREGALSELQMFFKDRVLSMPWQLDAVFVIGSSGRLVVGEQIVQQ